MDFWDDWFKRFGHRSPFFGDIDRMIEEMEKEMAKAFKEMEKNMSIKSRLPEGSIRKEYGPYVYGYSVKIGPDGKPIVREFGNMKPGIGQGSPPVSLSDKREPLVDTIEDKDSIKILAELPGVEKKDIKLHATSNKLIINVDNPDRSYYKELEFPFDVDVSTARSSYKNGVLEVNFTKLTSKESGKELSIE
jgi:HSP20 family protein